MWDTDVTEFTINLQNFADNLKILALDSVASQINCAWITAFMWSVIDLIRIGACHK